MLYIVSNGEFFLCDEFCDGDLMFMSIVLKLVFHISRDVFVVMGV